MVSRIQNYATNAHLEGDLQLAKNVIAKDNEVNRLYFFWKHSLNEYSKFGSWRRTLHLANRLLDYRLLANLVESICDYSASVGEAVIK